MSTSTRAISRQPQLRAPSTGAHPLISAGRPTRAANSAANSIDGPGFRQIFERTVKQIATGQRNVDRALHAIARTDGTMSNERLIVMQATVYRFTQEVEMASKLVDKATGALRQTLQSQQ